MGYVFDWANSFKNKKELEKLVLGISCCSGLATSKLAYLKGQDNMSKGDYEDWRREYLRAIVDAFEKTKRNFSEVEFSQEGQEFLDFYADFAKLNEDRHQANMDWLYYVTGCLVTDISVAIAGTSTR